MAISGWSRRAAASLAGRGRLAFWRRCASLCAIAIGALALLGWWLPFPSLTSVLARWPTMKPATGFLAMLSGASLLLVEPERSTRARWAGKAAAAVVAAVSLVTMIQQLVGSSTVVVGRVLTGRPIVGPLARTSASFFLIAAGVIAIDRVTPRGRSPSQSMALVAGSIGVIALLGYMFGIPELHGGIGFASGGMALQTACTLVLLSSSLLVTRPHVGFVATLVSEHSGGVVARRGLLGLLMFVPVALLVTIGRRVGLYGDPGFAALLVFLALVGAAVLMHVTALRLNEYDIRQKGAEALIRQSEQRFSQLIGHAPDGIFIADLEGRYTDVNDAGCRLLGLPRDQIVGRKIVDFIPPEDEARLWRDREELLGGSAIVSEWSFRCHDGYIPVEVSAAILPDGRWQGFMRDISDRKRVEVELAAARENDRQLRAELQKVMGAATSVSESVAELPRPDITAVLQTIALQAQALTGARYVAVGLGTDPERPIEPWVSLGIPDDVAEKVGRPPRPVGMLAADVVPENARSFRTDDVRREPRFQGRPPLHPEMASFLSVPIRYRRRHIGTVYLASRQGDPSFTAQDQRMVEMLAARAAVALETAKLYAGEAQQRAWLRSVIEQLPEGVVILDRHGRVVATNRALLSFLTDGRGPMEGSELRGFDLKLPNGEPIPPEDLPSTRALQRGEPSMGRELALFKPGNGLTPVLANAAPIRDDGGAITGATIIIQDITARKELERMREEWASVIAHDLRQPVSAISLSADALEMVCGSNLPEKAGKAITRIRAASTRLGRMVDDLFDASRIEANRLSVAPRAVDLGTLAAVVADGLRDETGDHDLVVDAAPAQVAWVDPDRIQQVLANLLTNAAKYGEPRSEIHVDVSDRGEVIEVAVTNRGPGIPADEIPRLFDRFWRARKARGSGTPGAGLGLYIAKGLVEAHGGRIWVESTPGETTTFHVLLPRAPAGAEIDAHGPQLHA